MLGAITHVGYRDWFNFFAASVPAEYGAGYQLYTARENPVGYNSVGADLTVASFPGYSPVARAKFDSSGVAPSGRAALFGLTVDFTGGAIVTPQAVIGFAVVNPGSGVLLALADFDTPITFAHNGDVLHVDCYLQDDGTIVIVPTFISAGP